MKDGRITDKDIQGFLSYIRGLDEQEIISAHKELQRLRIKNGGVIMTKDYLLLDLFLQQYAFTLTKNWKYRKPKRIWETTDSGKVIRTQKTSEECQKEWHAPLFAWSFKRYC